MIKDKQNIGMIGSIILIIGIGLAIYFTMGIEKEKIYRTMELDNNIATFIVDGVVYTRVALIDGKMEYLPDEPEKDHYTFDYWEVNGKKYDGGKLSNNTTLTAVFTENEDDYIDTQVTQPTGNNNTSNTGTSNNTSSTIPVTGVKLNKENLSLKVDSTEKLIATIVPSNATSKKITWMSNNSNVASVSETGVVTGVSAGTAKITARSTNGKYATCEVTITGGKIDVQSISLDKTEVTINKTDKLQLNATVKPSNATDKTIYWSSNNESVAKVSASGMVKGISEGEAKITAKTKNGKIAECKVVVSKKTVEVKSVKLNMTSAKIEVGKTVTLIATITPSNATNQNITWDSDKKSVATVTNGVVKGVGKGDAIITAVAHNGVGKECKVTVDGASPIEVTGIKVKPTSVSMEVGTNGTIKAKISPDNATDKSVTWTSTNKESVEVDQNGVIIAVGEGDSTIRATAGNGMYAECTVKVKPKNTPVESVLLKKCQNIKTGETLKLEVTVSPANATDKTITWSSSDTTVATVSSNGKVKGLKKGKTIITAKAVNGKHADCEINVKESSSSSNSSNSGQSSNNQVTFTCSGVIDRNGTNVNVEGDTNSVKEFKWDLDGKVVKGKKNYKNATKGFKKISVTLSLNNGTTQKVNCSVKDKLPYHFDPNNDKPHLSSEYCGKISNEENKVLNNLMYSIIDEVGRGTRAGVVEAGRFLMGNIPYVIGYQGRALNDVYSAGLHFGNTKTSWGCRNEGYTNGMDCTGFMNWPFKTNGINRSYSNQPQPVKGNVDKIKVGDVLVTYDKGQITYHSIPYGHDEVVIGIDDKYIYTLSNILTRISKKNPPNPDTNCTNGNCFDNEHHNAYYRNVTYSNGDGKVTDMWIEW